MTATACACPVRIPGAARSFTGTRCCTTRTASAGTRACTCRCSTSRDGQPNFVIIDSLLSEEAVLGFEYGYAAAEPNQLVLWEAQFGDFRERRAGGDRPVHRREREQVGRARGLTMMLPHGYEGQGPEHSSARLERYLQLCAEYNLQVCVPSLPAQMFHVLRRQLIRPYRKPLIILSPKSLLRHKESVSPLEDR